MRRLRNWYLGPVPSAHVCAVRVGVAGFAVLYLIARLPAIAAMADFPAGRFDPVGPLAWLSYPPPKAGVLAAGALAVASGALFAAGRRPVLTGPAFALLLLGLTTYRNSWGKVIHTENLMVLHVLVLGIGWSLAAGRRHPGWPVRLAAAVTALVYVVAGVAKLRNGGSEWIAGDVLRNQVAYDNLRKALLGAPHSPIGAWSVRHSWPFLPVAAATVVVELAAPFALLHRRAAVAWTIAAFGFHVGILALMWIAFPYPLALAAFLPTVATAAPGVLDSLLRAPAVALGHRRNARSGGQRRLAGVRDGN